MSRTEFLSEVREELLDLFIDYPERFSHWERMIISRGKQPHETDRQWEATVRDVMVNYQLIYHSDRR